MAGMFDDVPVLNFDAPAEEVRAALAKLPEKQRKEALTAWADTFVAKEREQGGVGQAINNGVRALARGTPVGSWLDEANAATSAGLNAVSGGYLGAPYDEAKAYQNAQDRAFDKANPATSTGLQIAGAVASAPAAPMANVIKGGSLGAQTINAGLTGLGYGAAYGAGEGEGAERVGNAAKGAAIGGALGAAAPAVARGASNAAEYVMNAVKGVPQPLRGYERGAVSRVARALTDDGMTTPAQYNSRMGPLGAEGMLSDVGQNLQNQAGAIANQPGRGQDLLVKALEGRKAGAATRIGDATDNALGPRLNLPETEDALRKYYGDLASPYYDAFYSTPVPFSREVEATLQRVDPSIIREAEALMRRQGKQSNQFFANVLDNGQVDIKRVPNAMEWDYIKRAVDDAARNSAPRSNSERIWRGLASDINSTVDNVISPNDPARSTWARARKLSGEGIGLREAMDNGQGAFSKGLSADQMQFDMRGLSDAELAAYKAGARAQVDDVMRNAGTQFGPNGDSAARKLLGNENARDKLGLIAGQDAADGLLGRLDAETSFEKTRQAVTQNSATSRRLQAQKEFPNPADMTTSIGNGGGTLYGRLEQGALKALNAMTGGVLADRQGRISEDAAKMLSAMGPEGRDALARGLMTYSKQKQMSREGRDAIKRLAEQLMRGTQAPAISAATD